MQPRQALEQRQAIAAVPAAHVRPHDRRYALEAAPDVLYRSVIERSEVAVTVSDRAEVAPHRAGAAVCDAAVARLTDGHSCPCL